MFSVIYKHSFSHSLDSEPIEFLNPNTFSLDTWLDATCFSYDGSIMAYTISNYHSDWRKIKFRDVETGVDHPDLLKQVKYTSMVWTHDNEGLFYCVNMLNLSFTAHLCSHTF